jgi:hypothetical protein
LADFACAASRERERSESTGARGIGSDPRQRVSPIISSASSSGSTGRFEPVARATALLATDSIPRRSSERPFDDRVDLELERFCGASEAWQLAARNGFPWHGRSRIGNSSPDREDAGIRI